MAPAAPRAAGLAPAVTLAALALRADASPARAGPPTPGSTGRGYFTYDDIMDGVLSYSAKSNPMRLEPALTKDLFWRTPSGEDSGSSSTDETSSTARSVRATGEHFAKTASEHFAELKRRTTHLTKTGSELRAEAQARASAKLREAARREAARREAARREEAERREAERREAERKADAERLEAERRREAERREVQRREAERRAEAARERKQRVGGLSRRLAAWSDRRLDMMWVDKLRDRMEVDAAMDAVEEEVLDLRGDIENMGSDLGEHRKVELLKEVSSILGLVCDALVQHDVQIWAGKARRFLAKLDERMHGKRRLRGEAKQLNKERGDLLEEANQRFPNSEHIPGCSAVPILKDILRMAQIA